MDKKRLCLTIIIAVSFSIWGICPWSNSSLAAKSYYSAHAVHGHTAGHEEEDHHASKGYDHGCINPISYSKEDTTSKILSIYIEYQEMGISTNQVTSAIVQFFDSYPPRSFVHLYQLYSVYRI